MTARTHNRTLLGRIAILAALGVTSLALIAASPADAIYRDYEVAGDWEPAPTRTVYQQNDNPPVDENGKKSCPYKKWDGTPSWYPHGTVITLKLPDGTTKSAKCNDGEWEAALTQAEAADYHFQAEEAYSGFYTGP
jgi:hypothetical protein